MYGEGNERQLCVGDWELLVNTLEGHKGKKENPDRDQGAARRTILTKLQIIYPYKQNIAKIIYKMFLKC